MALKPVIRQPKPKSLDEHIKEIMQTPGKYITEVQLADILGMSVKQAVIKAIHLNFSRIHVERTRCYSKRQVQAYLNKTSA